MTKLTSLPIVSFVLRYWLLLVLFAGFGILALNGNAFKLVGQYVYVPPLVILAALCAVLLRNVFNPSTTDRQVDSGEYDDAWNAMTPFQRFNYTFWERLIYFAVAGLIVAALAK